jgi:hypothetical protein
MTHSVQEPIAYTPDGQPVFPAESTPNNGERQPIGVLADGRPVWEPVVDDPPAPPLNRVPQQGFRTERGSPPAERPTAEPKPAEPALDQPAGQTWRTGSERSDRRRLLIPALVVAALTIGAVIWGISTAGDAETPLRTDQPVSTVVDQPLPRPLTGGITAGP